MTEPLTPVPPLPPLSPPPPLTLRPVTPADADLLLTWRNDPQTRAASHHDAQVTPDEHQRWLAAALGNPARQLWIVEENGVPVGTMRADLAAGIHELSWTVAPNARGRGIGKRMVALLASRFPGPIRAEVREGNPASAAMAESAGLTLQKRENGVLHFFRPARL
jgi:RimJ/RimL family protein N-acetyltransferase